MLSKVVCGVRDGPGRWDVMWVGWSVCVHEGWGICKYIVEGRVLWRSCVTN